MTIENPKHMIFKYDYLTDIKDRLSQKAELFNASEIHRQTNVPRPVINQFMRGYIPNTSFSNIVKLYEYLETQNV